MKTENIDISASDVSNYERIGEYMRGQMTSDKEKKFLKDLTSDALLLSQAVCSAHLAKAMKEVGEASDSNIKDALMTVNLSCANKIARKAVAASKENSSDYKKIKRISGFLSLAAIILVLFTVGSQYYDYHKTISIGEKYSNFKIQQQLEPVRGTAEYDQSDKELTILFDNANKGKDLGNTVKRLTVLWQLATIDTYNEYTESASEIGWHLAIAYLKEGKKDEAIAVIDKLTASDDLLIRYKARNIKKELK